MEEVLAPHTEGEGVSNLITITPPSGEPLRQPSGEDSDPCVDGEESESESETGGSERKDNNNNLAPSNGLPMSVSAPAPGVVDRRTDRLRKRTSLQRKNRYSVSRGLTNPIPTSNGSSQNPNNNGGLPYSYSVPSFLELAARNGVSMAGTLLSPRSPSRRPQSIIIFGNRKGDMNAVKAGTLDQLLAFMVDGRDYVYIETFIATHTYFVGSDTLLTRLMEKFYDGERMEVLEIFRIWIDFYWDDFQEENLVLFNMFISDLRSKGEQVSKKANELFDMLRRKRELNTLMDKFGHSESIIVKDNSNFAPIELKISGLTPGMYSPIQIATRMTMIENEMFKDIPLREYLQTAWNQKTTKDGKPNPRGERLRLLIEHSNKVSYWAATCILTCGYENKIRKKMIVLFIDSINACLELQNFQSAMQLYTALNLTPISRLAAWKSLGKKANHTWETIVEFFNPTHNFKNYRARLSLTKPPAIPLLSVILSDLTMIEENKNLIHLEEEGEVIHFEKMSMIYDSLSVLKRLLSLTPPMRSPRSPKTSDSDNLLVLLNLLPHLPETELYEFKGEQDKIKVKQLLKEFKDFQKMKKKTWKK